jgi:hypothetical protein
MSFIFEKTLGIYSTTLEIFSHLWVYILLWLAQFIVVWAYMKYENYSIKENNPNLGDVGGILLKFRIMFIIAILLGYYLGRES